MRLGFLTACMPDRSLEEIAAWAAEHRFEALEVAAWPALGDRPFTATHIDVASLSDQDADGHPRAVRPPRPDVVVAGLLRQQPPPRPDRAQGRQRPRAGLRRRRRPARLPDRRDLRRPRPDPARRRQPPPGRAGLPAAGRPRGRTGREADHRELRDGGLAPRRLPGQPGLLARAVGVDVLPRPVPELRPLAPGLDGDRPGRPPCGPMSTGSPTPRPRTSSCSPTAATATAGRARRSSGPTPGTSAGGATGFLASARSTGGGWSTPSTRAASTGCCRSSTRTRSGAGPRTRSRPGWTSPITPCGRCWWPDVEQRP